MKQLSMPFGEAAYAFPERPKKENVSKQTVFDRANEAKFPFRKKSYADPIPPPRDESGNEIRFGRYQLFQRTDGRYIIYDHESEFGGGEVKLFDKGTTVVEATAVMLELFEAECALMVGIISGKF